MFRQNVELVSRSLEEIANESENPQIRAIGQRVTQMRDIAEAKFYSGLMKVSTWPVGLVIGGYVIYNSSRISEDPTIGLISGLMGAAVVGGSLHFLLHRGVNELNASALARGEVQSLTTALASHIIAGTPPQNPQSI